MHSPFDRILAPVSSGAGTMAPRASSSQIASRTLLDDPFATQSIPTPSKYDNNNKPSIHDPFSDPFATPTTSSPQQSQQPKQLPSKLTNRKPKKGCEITPNPLRPNVRAADRIHAWNTPYSIQKRLEESNSLPAKVIELGEQVMAKGTVKSTKEVYAAGLLRYNQFGDLMGISEDDRMPASDRLIIGFIGHYAGKVSGKSISNWLSGLRLWHETMGAPWPADSRRIRQARRGANIEGSHHKRSPRHPITIEHMRALHKALNFSIHFHCAVWALACTAFLACRRLGELTIPSQNAFNPKFHVSRNTNSITFTSKPASVHFHIPWTKTTKEEGASVVATSPLGDNMEFMCPSKAIQRHLAKNADIPEDSSLFGYIDENGKPQHMVKKVFLEFCFDIWNHAALQSVLGHSFRIGGAVWLLLAGVPPEIVAATGGWTSLAFLLYWRRLESIIPQHITKAYEKSQWNTLRDKVDSFRKTNKISNKFIEACVTGNDIEIEF
ncbi:hypothetical protein HHX47_DHR3000756 [Lentinula edodes]|nr:hypothetical protein HHX47_DHR3000756 [Lentinula edodes]